MKKTLFVLVFASFASFASAQEPGRGYKPPTPEQRKAMYAVDRARNGGRLALAAKMAILPPKFDCVEMGWVPPVRDQGSCGSCYGVATADQLTCAFIKGGHQKPDDSFEINFQFGLDCRDFGGCNGGWGAEVAEWMVKNGFPAERYIDDKGKQVNDYPAYEARPRTCREKLGAKRWKPAAWGFCSGDDSRPATVKEIKTAVMQYGVLNIAFRATNAYVNAGKKVIKVTGNADHETTLVGWDDAIGWKTRGNWGKGLGDGGYVWFTFDSELVDPFWMTAPPIDPMPPEPTPGDFTPPFNNFVGMVKLNVTPYLTVPLAVADAQKYADANQLKVDVKDSKGMLAQTVAPTPAPVPPNGDVMIKLTPGQVEDVLRQVSAVRISPKMTLEDLLKRMQNRLEGSPRSEDALPLSKPCDKQQKIDELERQIKELQEQLKKQSNRADDARKALTYLLDTIATEGTVAADVRPGLRLMAKSLEK